MGKNENTLVSGSNGLRLAGDWAPRERAVEYQVDAASLLLANLEGPILQSAKLPQARPKAGPAIFNHQLPNIRECIWALANNHLMDYGESGLIETESTIKKYKHFSVGAGLNISEAAQPFIFVLNDIRIGIISRCEVQFGIATEFRSGVAALDANVYQAIRKLKNECDVVITSIHAAAELCPWPSPRRQVTWRAMVDAGADVVHGHHAHVPQGWEQYGDGMIFYGLGNLCVDPVRWSHHRNALWSLSPELILNNKRIVMRPATTVIEDIGEKVCVRDSKSHEAEYHQQYLTVCNRPLADRRLLESLWQEAAVRMYEKYFNIWLGFGRSTVPGIRGCVREYLRRAGRKIGVNPKCLLEPLPTPSQNQNLLWYHLFACDSHNDAIGTALGVLGGEIEDLRNAETISLVNQMMPNIEG